MSDKKTDPTKTFKLKPVPFGIRQLTEEAMKGVEKQVSEEKQPVKEYFKRNKNHATVIVNRTTKQLIHTIPIQHKDKMFISQLHLLPILYFNVSSDLMNMAESIVKYTEVRNQDCDTEAIIISEENYNAYVSYKISSIIMLHTAIDATLNYVFPKEKKYFSKKAKKEIGKEEFEDLPFMDKVKECFREVFDYNICDEKNYNIINEINIHRTNVIHINTTLDRLHIEKFCDELGAALNIDFKKYMQSIVELFKKFRPDLFVIESLAIDHIPILPGTNALQSIYYPIVNNLKKQNDRIE